MGAFGGPRPLHMGGYQGGVSEGFFIVFYIIVRLQNSEKSQSAAGALQDFYLSHEKSYLLSDIT